MGDLEGFSQGFIREFNRARNLDVHSYGGLTFIDYLSTIRELMSTKTVINPHWDTQLPRNVNFRLIPDYIVKQESFTEDIMGVNQALSLPNVVPRKSNVSQSPPDFNEQCVDRQ